MTSFPEVREDLAVVVPERVSAEELLSVIRASGQPLLADAEVFDVYRDAEKLGAGNVSLAVRLRSAPPTGPSPTPRWRACASRSSRPSPTDWGARFVGASVSVFGAAGFTGR